MNAYLDPRTARALLAYSRRRTQALRQARALRSELLSTGWDREAAVEMVRIHVRQRIGQ